MVLPDFLLRALRPLGLLLLGVVWCAGPVVGQSRPRAATAKTSVTRKPPRDPNAPPLFALPAFVTPAKAPLTAPLQITRAFMSSSDNGGDNVPDTIVATLQYVAPGHATDTVSFRLHDPDDRFYGFFRPNQHAHFRLDEQTPAGTLTHYFIINHIGTTRPGDPGPWFRTTDATAYPPGHPNRPTGARAGFLELEYHPTCELQPGRPGSVTKLLLRQPDTGTLLRYE